MGKIRIITPPRSLYVFGVVAVHDMLRREELGRTVQGGVLELAAEAPIELGIAWGRGSTPPVKLRFTGVPGRTYILYWLRQDFGAGMGVEEKTSALQLISRRLNGKCRS